MDFFKKNNTSRYPTDILIGELFVKAGVITQKQLDDTVRSAGAKHLHIGQMLVMSGFIKQQNLQAAVDLQSLIRDKVVDMNMAARCLKISVKTGASIVELVREEQNLGSQNSQTNRLGELLVESGLINKGQLSAAMQRSVSTGLPLGRILVLNNSIGDALLRFALDLQVRVRDEMIDRSEAIENLRTEAARLGMKLGYYEVPTADPTVTLKPFRQKVVKLGELLVAAQFLNETDVMSCLELGLLTERPIGEIMVEQGYISSEMLNVALIIQQMVEEGVLDKAKGGEKLTQIRETNIITPDVLDRVNGRFDTDSFSTNPEHELEDYQHSYDEQAETLAPGQISAEQTNYDLAADLQEFDTVSKAPKTGRHSSSRQNVQAPIVTAPPQPPSPIPASNFEEAPSLESLMAGFGGAETSDPSQLFAEASFSQTQGNGNGTGSSPQTIKDQATTADQPGLAAHFQSAPRLAPVPAHPFESLLVTSSVVTVKDIEHAFEQARTNPLLMADILHQTGLLTEAGRTAALDCHNLIVKGHFDSAQGAKLLDHTINQGRMRNLTLDDAMLEMGMALPNSLLDQLDALDDVSINAAIVPDAAANLVDSLAKESGEMAADSENTEEPKAEDLLRELGLTDSVTTASDEVLAKSALTGAAAESLMASLMGEAPEEAAMKEAAQARPDAFQTTAVFKSITDEELDRASALVSDAPADASLDNLLQRLEGGGDQASAEPSLADFMAQQLPLESVSEDTGEYAGDYAGGIAGGSTMLTEAASDAGTAGGVPENTSENTVDGVEDLMASLLRGNGHADDAAAAGSEPADSFEDAAGLMDRLSALEDKGGTDAIVQELNKKPTEEVDLRSLFSSLSIESPAKQAKAAAAAAASSKESPAPVLNNEPAPESTPELESKPEPAPTPVKEPVPEPKPQPVKEPEPIRVPEPVKEPEPEPVKALVQQAEPTPTVAETPVAAPAPIPVATPAPMTPSAPAAEPLPVAASSAPDPAIARTKSLASVSNSKLPTMSEAEIFAAKTAQISAMATALTKMAEMHYEQANYAEAQKAYERILSWRQGELGSHHLDLVDDLNNLAGVMCVQELFEQAEPMIRRAVEILENAEVPEPMRLAENLTSLAGLQFRLGVFEQAEPLLAKSLALREQIHGPESTELADPLRDYAKLLKKLGRMEEAEQYYSRAKVLLARRKAEAAAT